MDAVGCSVEQRVGLADQVVLRSGCWMQGVSGLGDRCVVAGGARGSGSLPGPGRWFYAGLPGRDACWSAEFRSFQRSSMCSQPTLRRRSPGGT